MQFVARDGRDGCIRIVGSGRREHERIARTGAERASTSGLARSRHYAPGEIDGVSGASTRSALAAFQSDHGLAASGEADEATWQALGAADVPTRTVYTLSDADVAGPFGPVPQDMMAKADLKALVYSSPIEALGERVHASPKLLQRLNPGADFTRVGSRVQVPNVSNDPPAGTSQEEGRLLALVLRSMAR